MTHNGRDHWTDMNAEQRARLIRDMPLEPMPAPRFAKRQTEWTRWLEVVGVCAIVFVITVWAISHAV